jgi:hypothetical protein
MEVAPMTEMMSGVDHENDAVLAHGGAGLDEQLISQLADWARVGCLR